MRCRGETQWHWASIRKSENEGGDNSAPLSLSFSIDLAVPAARLLIPNGSEIYEECGLGERHVS